MEYLALAIFAALIFGVCFLVDRLFTRLFRNKPEHKQGKTVRHNSRTAAFGLVIAVIGVAAVIAGFTAGWLFFVGGPLLIVVGGVLVAQYLSFGIFYLEDTFVYTAIGKKSTTYAYRDIQSQQLYNNHGHTLIELHMADGKSIILQSTMNGLYPFLEFASARWLQQTGRSREDCTFYDPGKSCWFPPREG